MFYIDPRTILKKRELFKSHILPATIVLLALVGLSIISWNTSNAILVSEQQEILRQKNDDTVTATRQRLDAYADILRGGIGLFNASSTVTREEWRQYLTTYDIPGRYPGIQGIGYVDLIPAAELPAHVQAVRKEGSLAYDVFPAGPRDMYTSIVYVEPATGKNVKAFGYDMYTEQTRRVAMDKARDTGDINISNVVTLIQDADEDSSQQQPGFLMYAPLYTQGSKVQSIQDRRTALSGFVYASFRSYDFMNKTITNQDESYGFQIYDLADGAEHLLYQSVNFDKVAKSDGMKATSSDLSILGIKWRVDGVVTPLAVSRNIRVRPMSVLWGGLLFSVVTAGFLYLLLLNRTNKLAKKEEQSIQEAKDELLALASHQLRTPATGVKQYIGMLREGLAGKLTSTQKKLVEKAYESNERQLNTINEMLLVARADAGHLKVDKSAFRLDKLIQEIADEHQETLEQRNQTLRLRIPKKTINFYGDRRFIRMVIENLVSNATKYTREGGVINISLSSNKSSVTIKVGDSGVGVAANDFPLLFQKFSRIPNELTSKVSGSGIGLYVAKKLVDAHGGTITFNSKPEKGSQVVVSLPEDREAALARNRQSAKTFFANKF